jgi:hypothetical protein
MMGEMVQLHELVHRVRYRIPLLLVVCPWGWVAQEAVPMVGQMEDQVLAMSRANQVKAAMTIQGRDRLSLFHLRAETPVLSLC